MSIATIEGRRSAWRPAFVIVTGLATATLVRLVMERSVWAGFVAGAVFGGSLLVIARASGWRIERITIGRISTGLIAGAVLIAIPRLIDPATAGFVGIRPQPWALWAGVTIVVAASEEALLRGALFDAVRGPGGDLVAVAATSVAFALMHVPLYGWSVVPLDLAVGVWLGGLRLATGGVVAPAAAHALADLGTW